MKKTITLLALLVTMVTGAQAAVTPLTTATIEETTLIYTSPENLSSLGYAQDGKGTQTYSPVSDRGNGMDPTDETNMNYAIGTTATMLKGAGSNKEVLMYVTNVKQVDAYVKNNGGDGRQLIITATPSSGTALSITATEEQGKKGFSGRISLELDPTESYTISFTCPANDICLYAVRLIVPDASEPIINAGAVSIMATEIGEPSKTTEVVTGTNLTGTTLTAVLSPAVDGMSVVLSSSEITDGSIETEVTITYTSDVNVEESTTTLILSDGTTTKEVTVTYSAFVELYEQESISDATTWDFSTAGITSGNVQYGSEDRMERLYANVTDFTFADSFNAKALTFEGEWARRNNQYAQNGTLRFKTTVAGTVEVSFSNTGGSNKNRFVAVNGVQGEVEADGTTVRTEEFEVEAGDVEITGVSVVEGEPNALRFFKVVFTPSEEPVGATVEVTFNKYGLGTFYYSDMAFVIPEGVMAATYALNADNTKVQPNFIVEAGGMIAAGVPVVIKGEPNETYTFNEALDAANAIQDPENILIGQEEAGVIEGIPTAEHYYYTLGAKDGVCGFYWGAADGGVFELGAHKAYLALTPDVASNAAIVMFDGEVSAIHAIQNGGAAASDAIYNLNGQKVNSQYKGVVIQNGKKLIRK